MVDSRIAMSGTPIDTGTPVNNAAITQTNNALSTEKMLQTHYETMDAREKSRLSSTVAGAAQLKTYLDRDDVDGAHEFLMSRKNSLHSRMASGDNVDTAETDYAIEALRTGKVDQLRNDIDGIMAAGQVYGILNKSDMPANIQEWQQYSAMSPEQQQQYLTMKRANAVVNLGGSQMIPNPVNPAGAPLAQYGVTPKPEDMPDFKKDVAQATESGKLAGENSNKASQLGILQATLQDLAASSKSAPSGTVQDIGATLANKANIPTKGAVAQGDFVTKRAAAENEIRAAFRVAGSGANSDRDAMPFIEMLPVASDSEPVKVQKVASTMKAVQNRIDGMKGTQQGAQQSVTVVNQQTGEQLEIDAADLPAAEAEGFTVVQ